MSEGVRAKLAVHAPESCPVAALSEADSPSRASDPGTPPVRDVTWTRGADGRVVEEFRADERVVAARPEALAEAEPIVTLDDERVYQFVRDRSGADACVCEVVERLDCPVADVRAVDGALVLTLHLPDVERLRAVVTDLDDRCERVELRCLVRSSAGTAADRAGSTVVDRGRLTDRQREVLRTAYEAGYFDYRGGANAGEVADELGVADSTFAEHLAAAQAKLVDEFLST